LIPPRILNLVYNPPKGKTGNKDKKQLRVQFHLVWMMMVHGTSHMLMVQGGAERLGSCVAWVDDAGDVVLLDDPALSPLLDCKVLDIDVTGAGGWLPLVDHGNGSLIVNIDFCRVLLFKTELLQDRLMILGRLGTGNCSNKLSLSR